MRRWHGALHGLVAIALLVSCSGEDVVDAGGGRELLERVQAAHYREWRRAPGWAERMSSVGEGHGGQLDIYVNDAISAVLDSGRSVREWPVGSTIVKDVWRKDTLHAIAIMDKRQDGWFWAEFDGNGDVSSAGHPQGCIDCHQRGADYVRAFTLP